ncbi:uncharacterized protein K02A2.6-like [Planococcus citri]|uniref:uncharacterized protein K02A2.6-like n=1 Tax=Planococcus citri TaxID=170843 RepID=UPI0031F7ABE6
MERRSARLQARKQQQPSKSKVKNTVNIARKRKKRLSSSKMGEEANAANNLAQRIANFKFQQFDPKQEGWRYYSQRFSLELTLQSIVEATDKRNLLLKCIGPTIYKLVIDHFDPDDVLSKTYDDITKFLTDYYKPTTNYLSERVNFGMCVRSDKQTLTQFLEELRSKAVHCSFKSTLDERLRDQFLLGINNSAMREKLYTEHPNADAKLADVFKTAVSLESAQQQRSTLDTTNNGISNSGETNSINKVRPFHNNNKPSNDKRTDISKQTIDAAKQCLKCGRKIHEDKTQCPALNSTCRSCNNTGHWDSVCIKTGKFKVINNKPKRWYKGNKDKKSSGSSVNEVTLHNIDQVESPGKKLMIDVNINGITCAMEYDSAAAVSTIGESVWKRIGNPALKEAKQMSAYTGIPLVTLGAASVTVSVNGITEQMTVYVIKGEATALFGIDWMKPFKLMPKHNLLRLESINRISHSISDDLAQPPSIEDLMKQYPNLFSNEFRKITNFKAHIKLKQNAAPIIARARLVPFAIKPKVEAELDRMVKCGMIEPIDPAKTPITWASPVVIKEKKNGKVRVIGDFKNTLNPNIHFEPYLLPIVDETLTKLSGYTTFSVADLKDAFMQLPTDEESQAILVIITHKGYFRYLSLPLGLTVSAVIFQSFMDMILAGIEGAAWFQDDIGFGGKNMAEHLKLMHTIFSRLNEVGLRTQKSKVKLFQDEIVFLGHRLSKEGVKPVTDRVAALKDLPAPRNQRELKSFLGSAIQYNKFVPNLLELCGPLYRKEKEARWAWTSYDQRLYDQVKNAITSDTVLAHYNPELPLILTTDASERGIGAILEHRYPDGTTRLISAASRVLSGTEQRYSTIDREALAIMFGVGKFEMYLFGRHFTLKTDHKPLQHIFGENSALPKLAATRLTRWAVALTAFNFTIEYKPGKQNHTADILSRLPVEAESNLSRFENRNSVNVNHTSVLRDSITDQLTLTQRTLKTRTIEDPILSKVMVYCKNGWPDKKKLPSDSFHTYFEKRDEIKLEDGILMWHDRMIIPEKLRNTVLTRLHETHLGSCSMRSLAKIVIWWPNCDREIEVFVSKCATCQRYQPQEPETPLNLWTTPNKPWYRIHIDFTGPFDGKLWLVIIDSFSNWLEIFPVPSANSANVIKVLRCLIARYGICNQIVSDNGTQFRSDEFKEFCKNNNIQLIFTTPYHSRSNGKVERAIRTFKWRYNKTADQISDSEHRLQAVLLAYRSTTHSATNRTPAELFLGRQITSSLELLKPKAENSSYKEKMKAYADKGRKERVFEPGEEVWYKTKNDSTWQPVIIDKATGPSSYTVNSKDKRQIRAHSDQLRRSQRETRKPQKLDL